MALEQALTALLNLLPADGEAISPSELRQRLLQSLEREVSRQEFKELQEALINSGKIKRTRAGIRALVSLRTEKVVSGSRPFRETEMEKPAEDFLHRKFVPDFIDLVPHTVEYVVQNTARGGAANRLWTRPDLALATVTRYPFQPVPELELYGFELKAPEGCTVYSVHEALAHAAFVHYSTLLLLLPEKDTRERNLPRMKQQAIEHGVGLIRVRALADNDFDLYEMLVEPRRKSPTVWDLNDFIESRFNEERKRLLKKYLSVCPQK